MKHASSYTSGPSLTSRWPLPSQISPVVSAPLPPPSPLLGALVSYPPQQQHTPHLRGSLRLHVLLHPHHQVSRGRAASSSPLPRVGIWAAVPDESGREALAWSLALRKMGTS
ncbi:hypothetical protein MSAN_01645200 [Mycena sanguinolenta]|uniref:Uncharacterized protein n=1 Tax=Mycena sanguinolenta TaxID=230812 RepID=A0A8H7CXC4_9AGAR|nr:hypothetical protein MSAN_01645200 [Mycena sanguinolenta]